MSVFSLAFSLVFSLAFSLACVSTLYKPFGFIWQFPHHGYVHAARFHVLLVIPLGLTCHHILHTNMDQTNYSISSVCVFHWLPIGVFQSRKDLDNCKFNLPIPQFYNISPVFSPQLKSNRSWSSKEPNLEFSILLMLISKMATNTIGVQKN